LDKRYVEENNMRVDELCTRNVITIEADASIVEAAKQMREHHVGDVVVLPEPGDRRPVGVLTDRDITVELVAKDLPLSGVSVGDVMSRDIVTVRVQDDLADALEIMTTNTVRRIPVIDEDDKIYGILSIDDVIGVIAEELKKVSSLCRRQPGQEKRRQVA
jgi:CBS domain-containing protein